MVVIVIRVMMVMMVVMVVMVIMMMMMMMMMVMMMIQSDAPHDKGKERSCYLTPELSLKTHERRSSVNCPPRTLLVKRDSTAFLLELVECRIRRTTTSKALWSPASTTPSMVWEPVGLQVNAYALMHTHTHTRMHTHTHTQTQHKHTHTHTHKHTHTHSH